MVNISVTEISRHLSNYLNRVAYKGEHFLLIRGKKAVAELKPAPQGLHLKDLPVLWASLPRLTPEEAEAWQKDLSASRKKLSKIKTRDPWVS